MKNTSRAGTRFSAANIFMRLARAWVRMIDTNDKPFNRRAEWHKDFVGDPTQPVIQPALYTQVIEPLEMPSIFPEIDFYFGRESDRILNTDRGFEDRA